MRWFWSLLLVVPVAHAQHAKVPDAPATDAQPQSFHDSKYGVRFQVPPGWSLSRQDGEISSFHLDAPTVPKSSEMRGAVSLEFNPFPQSVLSGATFYYSVEKHAKTDACAAEGDVATFAQDVQDIDGAAFHHGHAERGAICVETRDEIYTLYRKGSCYRFDLEVNTFCSVSSGASDLSANEMRSVQQRMADILSTVALDWKKKNVPHPVPVPDIVRKSEPEPTPRPAAPVLSGQ